MRQAKDAEKDHQPEPLPSGIVAELAGALKGSKIEDPLEEYTEYLLQKYAGR